VISENLNVPDYAKHDYDEAVAWLRNHVKHDPVKKERMDKVLASLDSNHNIGILGNITEKDLVTAVWRRSFDPANAGKNIKHSLADAILDCAERNHVVCITGRSSKIWQALARVDKDPEMGIFKTKQILRNEIYERAAKIVDEFIGKDGSASDALKKAYQEGENSEQVKELAETIKNKIDTIAADYPMLDKTQVTSILEECKAII
jgi:hypothetical protein